MIKLYSEDQWIGKNDEMPLFSPNYPFWLDQGLHNMLELKSIWCFFLGNLLLTRNLSFEIILFSFSFSTFILG